MAAVPKLTTIGYCRAQDRIDFETHYIYVSRLNQLSRNLSVRSTSPQKLTRTEFRKAERKLRLIELTAKSINDELSIVKADPDYSTASVLWLPVKTYYLLYHLLSVLDFMATGDPRSLVISHVQCTATFTRRLADQELVFSQPRFNQVFDKDIFNFKESSGQHLRNDASDALIYCLIMKKIAAYKLEDQHLLKGWNLRSPKGREKRDTYKARLILSIFDFFYLMRIKSNYRGLRFIDDIPAEDTARYFRSYFQTARNFYACFSRLKTELERNL
jgi:hypothetical protein